MNKSLADRTLERATTAMRKDGVACLPEIVKLMRTLSHNSSEVSVPELAEVIQQDPVIFSKVLSAANTLGYNPGRVSVTTVGQAIHIIGYERIRTLAISLLLVEQTSRTQGAEEQREVAALALTTGCIAQAAAQNRAMINGDEAFVCGSLRNFGRIIMVTCMLDDYRAAQQLAESMGDEAYRTTFGLTPLELGHQLLLAAELPDEILVTMRSLSPDALAALNATPSAQMLALADFAAKLSDLVLSSPASAAEFATQSKALAARYAHLLPDLAAEIMPLIDTATEQLNHFISTLKIKSLPARTLTRLRQRGKSIDPAASIKQAYRSSPAAESSGAAAATPTTANSTSADGAAAENKTAAADFCWQTEIDRLATLARSGRGSRTALLAAMVDSVHRGFAAPECLLFSKAPGASTFELTHGRGRSYASLGRRAVIRGADRTVFGVCLTRGENVVIHQTADAKILPYLPDWLRRESAISSFVLLPLVSEGQTDGVILAGWLTARQVVIAPEQARLIRSLLAALGTPQTAAA